MVFEAGAEAAVASDGDTGTLREMKMQVAVMTQKSAARGGDDKHWSAGLRHRFRLPLNRGREKLNRVSRSKRPEPMIRGPR